MKKDIIYCVEYNEEFWDLSYICHVRMYFNSLENAKEFIHSGECISQPRQRIEFLPWDSNRISTTVENEWFADEPEGDFDEEVTPFYFSVEISEEEIVHESIYEYEIHVSNVDQDIVEDDGLGIVVDTYAQAVKEARQKAESLGNVVIQSRNRAEKLCYGENCCTLFYGDATDSKSSNWAVWILKKKVKEVRKPIFKERKRRKG